MIELFNQVMIYYQVNISNNHIETHEGHKEYKSGDISVFGNWAWDQTAIAAVRVTPVPSSLYCVEAK